jgi:hypothetical protein
MSGNGRTASRCSRTHTCEVVKLLPAEITPRLDAMGK